WFTMTKEASPIAITFAADGSAKASGPLSPGATALVMYSTSRVHCASSHIQGHPEDPQSWLAGLYVVNGVNGWLDWGLGGPVNGYYRALTQIPSGGGGGGGSGDLALWFHDHSATCDHWDSDFGRNYHFAVTAPQ